MNETKTVATFCSFFYFLFLCSEDNDITIPRNLQDYFEGNSERELNKIIACAATADANESLSYIFYYLVEGAS